MMKTYLYAFIGGIITFQVVPPYDYCPVRLGSAVIAAIILIGLMVHEAYLDFWK